MAGISDFDDEECLSSKLYGIFTYNTQVDDWG